MNLQIMRQAVTLALQSLMLPIGMFLGQTVEAKQNSQGKEKPRDGQQCCSPWLKLLLALGGFFLLAAMFSKLLRLLGKRHADECDDCCCEDEDCDCDCDDEDCDCEDEDCECDCEDKAEGEGCCAEGEQAASGKARQDKKDRKERNVSQSGLFNFYFGLPGRK